MFPNNNIATDICQHHHPDYSYNTHPDYSYNTDTYFPRNDDGDQICQLRPYDTELIQSGLNSEENAVAAYKGTRTIGGVSADPNKVVFNTGSLTNLVTVQTAGQIAICYCQFVGTTKCENDAYFVLAARTTIRGPIEAHSWEFSTYVVFAMEYKGFGLANENKLRIIHPDGNCDDNGGNPDRGSYAYTSLLVECPDNEKRIGAVDSDTPGDLQTQLLSSEKFGCDLRLANCRTNEIKKITVISDRQTLLEFDEAPLLDNGDTIVITGNVKCKADSYQCTAEKLAELQGIYKYADGFAEDANDSRVRDDYFVGHKVTKTEDPKKYSIPVGFKEECYPNPGGSTQCGGVGGLGVSLGRPIFEMENSIRGMAWQRISRATTQWEIKGERELQNMKVCWNYGTSVGKYVTEVGKLTLKASDPMSFAQVSMTTKKQLEIAPVMISFKSAGSMTGRAYTRANGPTQIRLLFTEITSFEIFQTDFAQSPIVDSVNEDNYLEATQAICGKLFLELWSFGQEVGDLAQEVIA